MSKVALFIIGITFTIIQPILLWFKANKQVRNNKNISNKLHYTLNDEGILISQHGQYVRIRWVEIRKKIETDKSIYLYMSPIRAFIFPKDQCGGQFEQMQQIIQKNMQKVRQMSAEEQKKEWEKVGEASELPASDENEKEENIETMTENEEENIETMTENEED